DASHAESRDATRLAGRDRIVANSETAAVVLKPRSHASRPGRSKNERPGKPPSYHNHLRFDELFANTFQQLLRGADTVDFTQLAAFVLNAHIAVVACIEHDLH